MKTIQFSLFILLSFVLSSSGCNNTRHTSKDAYTELKAEEITASDQAFAFEFFANVFNEEAADKNDNFMISPFSLSMALAMTWNGAEGDTKTAIQKTLKLDNYTDEDVNRYYRDVKETLLNTDSAVDISVANSIWTNQNISIHSDFINTIRSYYHAEVEAVDFADPVSASRINKWVSDNTKELINNVISETKADDLMYLLNAVYFKGVWVKQFSKDLTTRKPFTNESGKQMQVDMMNTTDRFRYTEDETMQLVELPYGNKSFSMRVLLPKEDKKLSDIAGNLQQNGYWANLDSALQERKVVLNLPKFKTEYSKKLNDVLKKMGMGIAFTDAADFTRMTDESAQISMVQQDTYINTDESGTEAAAVTSISIELTSFDPSKPKTVIFNANRPFIYIIQEDSTGAVLFMGAVKDF